MQDVRTVWLRHLSVSPLTARVIWLIRLARQVSPYSITASCLSLPKLYAPFYHIDKHQDYMSCTPLLESPKKALKNVGWRYVSVVNVKALGLIPIKTHTHTHTLL